MEIINRKQDQRTQSHALSIISSEVGINTPNEYPEWLDILFLRFTAIYQARWTYAIQDERMLELTKFEWWETLKDFDQSVIMEVIADVKKIPGDFPSIQKFYEIATYKARLRKEAEKMAKGEREGASQEILEHKGDPQLAEQAREEIRKLCKLKTRNSDE